jgi:hypothetical protein
MSTIHKRVLQPELPLDGSVLQLPLYISVLTQPVLPGRVFSVEPMLPLDVLNILKQPVLSLNGSILQQPELSLHVYLLLFYTAYCAASENVFVLAACSASRGVFALGQPLLYLDLSDL